MAEQGDTSLTVLTKPSGSMNHDPYVLDDDETVLYLDIRKSFEARTWQLGVGTLSGSNWETRDLSLDAIAGVVNGILVYLDGGRLMAVRFDQKTRRPIGKPVRIDHAPEGLSAAVLASDGTLAMRVESDRYQIALVNDHGEGQAILPDTISFVEPKFSPDGKRAVIGTPLRGSTNAWMMNLADKTISKMGFGSGGIAWTRDGRRVAVVSGGLGVRWQAADGSDSVTQIPGTHKGNYYGLDVSPDGVSLALVTGFGVGGFNIVLRKIGGDTTEIPLVATPANEYGPRFSPDGHWLAYTSDETGRPEVYVRPFPGNGPRVQISNDGGSQAAWSGDSRRIFYRSGSAFMEATVAPSSTTLSVATRRKLFEGSYFGADPSMWSTTYDVSPDGHSFLVGRAIGESGDEIVVWTGWMAELEAQLAQRP